MNFDRMRYFVAAATYLSVTKASRSVHISPSAVSDAIAKLEEEFGCALFRRENRNLFLTDKGLQLKLEFEKIFRQLDSIKDSISDDPQSLRGEFRIGASTYLSSRNLSQSWIKLQKKHPDLFGEIVGMHTALIISELLKGSLDFALCFGPQVHPLLTQKIIHQGQLRIVVSSKHPILKLNPTEQIKQIGKYPAIIYKSSVGIESCKNHPTLTKYGIDPHYRLQADSDDQIISCVESSEFWGLLPDLCIHKKELRIREISHPADWKAPYSVYSVVRSDRTLHPALKLLEDELKKSFRL